MEAADHDAVVVGVEQREGEALVAAGVLERIEPDESDPLERFSATDLEGPGSSGQSVDRRGDLVDPPEMRLENRLEAPAVVAPGQGLEATIDLGRPAPGEGGRRQGHHQEHDEEPDDRTEIVLDERGHVGIGLRSGPRV